MTESRYRNRRLEALHSAGAALASVGALDKATMRDLDAFCLTEVGELSAADIRVARARACQSGDSRSAPQCKPEAGE